MNDLIGIPYLNHGRTRKGVDCWGLIYLDHMQAGIKLPSFSSQYADPLDHDRKVIAYLIRDNIELFEKVDEFHTEPHDVLLFNVFGAPSHVALFSSPGWMINVDPTAGVIRERYTATRWKNRLLGFYRYRGITE